MTDRRLEGRTAIVTGGSAGIGREIALHFARAGARVAILDLAETTTGSREPAAAAIASAGGEALFIPADVSDEDAIADAVRQTVTRWGRLDVMVNNAACFASARLTETTRENWERVLAVNLTGMYLGCKYAVKQMLRQEPVSGVRGRIVNITSQHGMVACPGDFAYGVSKAGGVYMTKQIAADYAKDLIVCNAVAPGKILTGSSTSLVAEEFLSYSRSRTPWPRLGEPADVARAALYLASDEASFVTGVNLLVDGGWMAA